MAAHMDTNSTGHLCCLACSTSCNQGFNSTLTVEADRRAPHEETREATDNLTAGAMQDGVLPPCPQVLGCLQPPDPRPQSLPELRASADAMDMEPGSFPEHCVGRLPIWVRTFCFCWGATPPPLESVDMDLTHAELPTARAVLSSGWRVLILISTSCSACGIALRSEWPVAFLWLFVFYALNAVAVIGLDDVRWALLLHGRLPPTNTFPLRVFASMVGHMPSFIPLGLDERGISRVLGCLPSVLSPAIAYFLVIVYEVRKAGFSSNDLSRVSAGPQMMSLACFLYPGAGAIFLAVLVPTFGSSAMLGLPIVTSLLEASQVKFIGWMHRRTIWPAIRDNDGKIKHLYEPNSQVTVNIILVHVAAEGGRIAAVMLAAIQNPTDWQGAILPLCLGVLINAASRTHLLAYAVMKMGEGMFPSLRAICRPSIQSALLQEVKFVVGYLRYVAILGVVIARLVVLRNPAKAIWATDSWLPPTLFVLAIALEIVEDLVVSCLTRVPLNWPEDEQFPMWHPKKFHGLTKKPMAAWHVVHCSGYAVVCTMVSVIVILGPTLAFGCDEDVQEWHLGNTFFPMERLC